MQHWKQNHGISVPNEIWILAAGECAGCWTGESSWVDAWKMSDAESLCGKKIRGPQCREDGVLSIHQKLVGWLSQFGGNGSDRHQRDLREIMQISGWIAESLMLLPCLSLGGFSGVLLSRCRSLSSSNVAGLPTQ